MFIYIYIYIYLCILFIYIIYMYLYIYIYLFIYLPYILLYLNHKARKSFKLIFGDIKNKLSRLAFLKN